MDWSNNLSNLIKGVEEKGVAFQSSHLVFKVVTETLGNPKWKKNGDFKDFTELKVLLGGERTCWE